MAVDNKTELYPASRQAVALAIQKFNYGDVISKEWLLANSGVKQPEGKASYAEWQSGQFALMAFIEEFRAEMLEEHYMYLGNVRGKGYLIVLPGQQTLLAMSELNKVLKKKIKSTLRALTNINRAQLTTEESQQNNDAMATLGKLKQSSESSLQGYRISHHTS